jgi:hypothetical protein
VAQTFAATFISLDRFRHQRSQRRFEILRRLVNADDIFVVGLGGGGNLAFESFSNHQAQDEVQPPARKLKNTAGFPDSFPIVAKI